MKKYPAKNNKPISRRQFLQQATSAAAGLAMGSSLVQGRTYKGKTRQFSTHTDCDVTFFAISDVHYGRHFEIGDNEAENKNIIDKMNSAPGKLIYPVTAGGGIVPQPRAVLVAGDLTDFGTTEEWNGYDIFEGFEDDYLGSGATPGRLNWPVYECFGNHDIDEESGSSDYAREQVRNRTLAGERPGTFDISDNGYHYSWTWDNIHFVNLNLYPGAIGTYAQGSLEFLINDLAKHIGSSGKAVVLYFHYDFIRLNWWEPKEQDAFYNAIKDYNIVAMIHGHRHIDYLESSTWEGINTFNVATRNGPERFTIFRIRKNHLFAGECATDTTWGRTFTKTITT